MHPGDHYKLKIATLSIFKPNSTPEVVPVVVQAGSVVEIVNHPEGTFVEVECEGRRVSMFTADVRERGMFLDQRDGRFVVQVAGS